MFELWIATWCATFYFRQTWTPCKDQSFAVAKSSMAILKDMIDYDVDEFWLYPMRDFEKEVVRVTIKKGPTITEEKKP